MTTFIKTKFKITDDQMNINKYRLSAKITVYHIIKSKNKKLLKSVKKQRNCALIKNAKIVMFKMDVRTSRY